MLKTILFASAITIAAPAMAQQATPPQAGEPQTQTGQTPPQDPTMTQDQTAPDMAPNGGMDDQAAPDANDQDTIPAEPSAQPKTEPMEQGTADDGTDRI